MIETATILGFSAGALAGYAHAAMLWRASHRLSSWGPITALIRLGIVAAVLVLAARYGQVLPAAGGWAIGFFVSALIFLFVGSKKKPERRESKPVD
jgi:hypothetical protein